MKTNWSAVCNVCLTVGAWFLAGCLYEYSKSGTLKAASMTGAGMAAAALINHLRPRPQLQQSDAPQTIQIPPKP